MNCLLTVVHKSDISNRWETFKTRIVRPHPGPIEFSTIEPRNMYFNKLPTFFLHTQLYSFSDTLSGNGSLFFPTPSAFPFLSYPWSNSIQSQLTCIEPKSSVEFCIHLKGEITRRPRRCPCVLSPPIYLLSHFSHSLVPCPGSKKKL